MSQIIACVDGSRVTDSVANAAIWVSKALDVQLLGFHALEHDSAPETNDLSGTLGMGAREDLLAQMIELEAQRSTLELQQAKLVMEAIRVSAEEAGCPSVVIIQRHGELSELLADFEHETRLVVLGRQGEAHEGFKDAIGSHIERVIRTLHKPVLIVAENFVIPEQVMIAFDGSQTAQKVLDLVAVSPLMRKLRCHIVMVDGDANVLQSARSHLDRAGFEVETAALTGPVVPALVHYQKQNSIGLTVMGAYGHSRIRQFFIGSQTTAMLQKSVTPLLFLR